MKRTMTAVGMAALLLLGTACSTSNAHSVDSGASASAEKPAELPADTSSTTASEDPSSTTSPTSAASSSTTTPSTVTMSSEAEFISKINSMCIRFNDEGSALAQPTSTAPEAIGAYFDQALALFSQQVDQMKTLTPPPSLAAPWAKIIQAVDAQVARIQQYIPRLRAGDTTALQEMQNLSDDDVNAQFDAIGASDCGSGGEL